VRVFNAPSLEESSFYGDSELFTVKSWKNEVFMANVAGTTTALDDADDDADGVNNSWEQSYGTDPGTADSDGDGQTDGEEVLAGTDGLDGQSSLRVASLMTGGTNGFRLRWASVPGKTYKVEHVVLAGDGAAETTLVGTIQAQAEETEYVIGWVGDVGYGCYRVLATAGQS
jgi:hypothetical protein